MATKQSVKAKGIEEEKQAGDASGQSGSYSGVKGLSTTTSEKLGTLAQGYQPSTATDTAKERLGQAEAAEPERYRSGYQSTLGELYDRIMDRGEFSYDLNGDALYDQYRQQYVRQGQQAMEDTMGRAAARTGGYGSSYAETAGGQAYRQYLEGLNAIVPELYGQAYSRWKDEGDALQAKYDTASDAEQGEYQRYRDAYDDWQREREYAAGRYDSERESDYQAYSDQLSSATAMAKLENSDYQNDVKNAQTVVGELIDSGVPPESIDPEVIRRSGYTEEELYAIWYASSRKVIRQGQRQVV